MRPILSKRTNNLKPEAAYAVLTKATALEAQGKNIIHFEIGQPDFPTPKNITRTGIKALLKGRTRYTPPLGIMPLRKKIAEEINKSRGLDISEKQIAITPSGKTAIFIAMAAILEEGDEVIHPSPCFPAYEELANYFGCVRKPIPLVEKEGFSFNMEVLKKNFSKKTKLIILNSPSNPTGGIIPVRDLLAIADLTKASRCWLMTDEMYSRIIYDGLKYPSFYAIKGVAERTILVDGFSKTYSMTGWRIGYLAAPERIMEKIDYLITHTVACTAEFTQYAALEALSGPQTKVDLMIKEFERRRDFVVSEINKIEGVSCQKPQGAFYIFPNIRSFKKSSRWLANYILERGGVALLDGTAFGKYGEGYLRISYATSMENLKEGLTRIKRALKNLKN